ncbi:N-acetyltransferase [Calothrix sp. PCC 7507]|uniref:GNAT family N-acetyltransferase n=1 Tax=Calothrix sp. PCC 7507 TaxID=99598 RepID=UPI00029F2132|nr:GNAT family N-acetyltransferase [Calothrix sp. PCC 7507]AFY34911.1 GCN5-related N-acetyltransferase [Calothrix sp. PCC 7507]
MPHTLPPGYSIRLGSIAERSLLVKFMQRSYQDIFPQQDFSHLAQTVEQYFSKNTPLWWVEEDQGLPQVKSPHLPIACLWAGNAIDQVGGSRHTHIFLLYVMPEHRRRGIGTALMHYVENWAAQRGDRQIGLQVFQSNQAALDLYNQLGYQTQSLWMVKSLQEKT